MYNPLLDTFIAVADCGSFTKAAEVLFISPTAVMKQMNSYENHLDLKLIERTSSGIRLTKFSHWSMRFKGMAFALPLPAPRTL